MSRESIVREIQKDMAMMQKIIDMLGYKPKIVSIDTVVGNRGKKRRKMSAAGRARIAAAQRARWARVKAGRK